MTRTNADLLHRADIAEMFNPIIDKALALVDEQLALLKKEKKDAFKVIALCGGLGGSEYVWYKFKEFGEKFGGHIQLVTDEGAWSAVCRGAAIRGLDGSMVLSKKVKRAIGIGVHQEFRKGIDKEEDSFMCPIKGKRAPGYIDWVVKRFGAFSLPDTIRC